MLPSTLLVQAALAADASGYLDAADGTHIAGWASDPDYAGPVQVHVYVDDVLVKALEASSYRADVGAHAFDWTHEPFGAGSHSVTVYAIGVDASGAPDGRNMALYGARSFEVGCAGLSGDPLAWCEGNPGYWEDRQADTEYVGNSLVRAGVNPSYGGTVFQLFDDDWERNLLMEHGGAAIQLSIWGYDPVGGTGWFGDSWCDSTPYASEASCLAAGHASCVARAYSAGDHVADCDRVEPCVGWNAGAPYNPIQAQGSACAWDNAANDAASTWVGSELRTSLSTPRHFTKDGAGVSGLTFGQAVTAGDAWIVLEQRIAYTGSQTWCDHDQETPAFFTAQDVDARFYWYEGDAPYADASSAVRTLDAPQNGVLLFPGVTSPTTLPAAGEASERWWGVCDASEDRCVTIASFEASLVHASLAATPGRGAYLTPMGHWNLYPGFDETFTTYVFPYRHDTVVAGRSVRDWIHTLAAENGCSAEIDCNGIDEDCTGADRCAPADTGGGDDDGDDGTDTGASGGGDTGEAPDSGAPDDGEAGADDAADDDDPGVPGRARVLDEGCGCVGGGLPSAAFLVPALLVALRVRRAPSVPGGRLRGRVGGG